MNFLYPNLGLVAAVHKSLLEAGFRQGKDFAAPVFLEDQGYCITTYSEDSRQYLTGLDTSKLPNLYERLMKSAACA